MELRDFFHAFRSSKEVPLSNFKDGFSINRVNRSHDLLVNPWTLGRCHKLHGYAFFLVCAAGALRGDVWALLLLCHARCVPLAAIQTEVTPKSRFPTTHLHIAWDGPWCPYSAACSDAKADESTPTSVCLLQASSPLQRWLVASCSKSRHRPPS